MQTVNDIINRYNKGESFTMIGFFGPNHPFSNFHTAPFEIGGNKFSCHDRYPRLIRVAFNGFKCDVASAQALNLEQLNYAN